MWQLDEHRSIAIEVNADHAGHAILSAHVAKARLGRNWFKSLLGLSIIVAFGGGPTRWRVDKHACLG